MKRISIRFAYNRFIDHLWIVPCLGKDAFPSLGVVFRLGPRLGIGGRIGLDAARLGVLEKVAMLGLQAAHRQNGTAENQNQSKEQETNFHGGFPVARTSPDPRHGRGNLGSVPQSFFAPFVPQDNYE
jgi:hypothetical protein